MTETKTIGRWLRPLVWGGAAALLALPAIAMRFTSEVDWSGFDFLVMGAMLLIVCIAFEVAVRIARNNAYLLAALGAAGTGFLLTWANLAVGFIGNEENPWNLMFFSVLLLMFAGALISRFRARGVAFTLFAGAAIQLAGCIAAAVLGQDVPFGPTLVFTLAWLLAGGLFLAASRQSA